MKESAEHKREKGRNQRRTVGLFCEGQGAVRMLRCSVDLRQRGKRGSGHVGEKWRGWC